MRSVCLALTLWTIALLGNPAPAAAQIYAWRDVNGTLVLSDRRMVDGAVTFAVPDAPRIRSTRPPVSDRARDDYEPLVQEHASRQRIRPDLVRAVIQVESGFNPRARSPKGAMGLMQLMPATAAEMGVRDPYDPRESIRGGTAYLRQLLDRYGGNEELALAAYNAGAGAVERHGSRIPPYRETREYVRRVASASGPAAVSGPPPAKRRVYKTYEVVDGRLIPRYSSDRPASVSFEIVSE